MASEHTLLSFSVFLSSVFSVTLWFVFFSLDRRSIHHCTSNPAVNPSAAHW